MRFVLRQEPFGYTFFDKQELSFWLLARDELEEFLKKAKIDPGQVELLGLKQRTYRKDILCAPIRVYFELTLVCNLRCQYCFSCSGSQKAEELDTKTIFKSLDHLKENNVLDVRFTGGEPTCRGDWVEIFKYAKNLGFAVSCNTNGAYPDPKINKEFSKLNLEQVTVSLDGDRQAHEINRGKGNFEKTIRNLKEMSSLGVKLRINTLVSKYSAHDVEKLIEIASKYAKEINFFTIEFIGRGEKFASSVGISVEEHYSMSRKIKGFMGKYPNLNILHFAKVTEKRMISSRASKRLGIKKGLPSGLITFAISSDGSYCSSGYMPHINTRYVLGNVKSDDLFSVWQKNPLLEKIRDDGTKLLSFCANCKMYKSKKCQGPKYETELNRFLHPEVKNPSCIFGNGPSLLKSCRLFT
jgi:MoaA/NifB/PqqE/SkfB family radical SAM enzyme